MLAPLFIYVIGPPDGLQNIGKARHVDVMLADLQASSPLPLIIHYKAQVSRPRRVIWGVHWALREVRQSGDWFDISPADAVREIQARIS